MTAQTPPRLLCLSSPLLVSLFAITVQAQFNRDICLQKVRSMLEAGTLTANDTCFYRDDLGVPKSSPENPNLTPDGCKGLCGSEFGWYKDPGPRLSTWLIPVFLLLSNMEVSPLDKRRYLMLIHLVGDPIDSLWSLLSKMEAWSRCYNLALEWHGSSEPRLVRNLATVLGGFEELAGFHTNPLDIFISIEKRSSHHFKHNNTEQLKRLIRKTAQNLADHRTDERLRTIFATVLYFYQLVSAFVSIIGGGSTSPPGGRIGIAMFMTWIIPSILLSNAIGGFTSRRTCFDILDHFIRDAIPDSDLWTELQIVSTPLQKCSLDEFFDSLAWSGSIYSYRPVKRLAFTTGKRDRSRFTLLLLALCPIVISSIVASVILWNTPPIGINCRNLLIFGIVVFIFLSAFLTSISSWFGLTGPQQWHAILIKDAMLAVPLITLVFLATVGLFNSCICWSGIYSLGAKAHVPLNPIPDFLSYNRTTYPILVSVCLTFQIFISLAMIRVGWRGWRVMRWSEEEKMRAWKDSRKDLHQRSIAKGS